MVARIMYETVEGIKCEYYVGEGGWHQMIDFMYERMDGNKW